MRLAAVVLAIAMIAACPPRRGRVVYVQRVVPCAAVPTQPATPPSPPAPPVAAAKPIDPVLEKHLLTWEKKIESISNLRAEITLKQTDAVFKKEANYVGNVVCLKPRYTYLRLENTHDAAPNKLDFEIYIFDGKSWYMYEGLRKTISIIPAPVVWSFGKLALTVHTPVLDLLIEPKAKEINERFDVKLFKVDERYLYLDIKPRTSEDEREFKQLRLALYGPGKATEKLAYLPAQFYILKPNGDTVLWKFSNLQVDFPGVDPKMFKMVEIKGWTIQGAPKPEKP